MSVRNRRASAPEDISVYSAGRLWRLQQPGDLETLWEAMTQADMEDERIPYWTELWPASLALGGWLKEHARDLEGRYCLDIGCGLGLDAIIGAWLGARVAATDYEPQALMTASRNAHDNGVENISWICMDWRCPALAPQRFEYIWAADIIYEKRSMRPILDLLDRALAPAGSAWIAEPGRSIFRMFLEQARERGWSATSRLMEHVPAIRPPSRIIGVTIWELRRAEA